MADATRFLTQLTETGEALEAGRRSPLCLVPLAQTALMACTDDVTQVLGDLFAEAYASLGFIVYQTQIIDEGVSPSQGSDTAVKMAVETILSKYQQAINHARQPERVAYFHFVRADVYRRVGSDDRTTDELLSAIRMKTADCATYVMLLRTLPGSDAGEAGASCPLESAN
jgi:hypothetical protein